MDINKIISFKVGGDSYTTMDKAVTHVSNRIGLIIDKMNPRLPPKQALQLQELIISNREELVDLLSSTIQPDDLNDEPINIFEWDT